ncbi:MAG: NADH-quinone oxidoreductase subunit H [Rhodospirillaceae bacterium]
MAIIGLLLLQGFQMMLVLAVAPLVLGCVRKLKARLLGRCGPSPVQPYFELARLFAKETVVADNASWLFTGAPYVIFGAIWVAASLVPTYAVGLIFSWSADIIVIVGLLALARFFLTLAGLDVGTAFGGIGTSRELMIASLAEPAMLMIVFTLSLLAGSTQLSSIAHYLMTMELNLRVSIGLVFLGLTMVAIAENGRIPVDNPATHLELTMIHEAMILEYSGRHLALIELAAALKLTLYLSLLACVFVPWGMADFHGGLFALMFGMLCYPVKLAAGIGALALFEISIAKMRVFRVVDFLTFALMLGLLATLLLFVSRSF